MPHVLRDPQGQIISLHREAVPGATSMSSEHPEVLAFLGQSAERRKFADLDADLVRVIEDVIDVLIKRNVLCITDLPSEAQGKLFDRKHFREGMQSHSLKLFGSMLEPSANNDVVSTDFASLDHQGVMTPPARP